MTTPTSSTYLGWMLKGHEYFLSCLTPVSDEELDGPSRLPDWTGRHLLSHVGHNARALARLAHWAATGEPTPMYPSPSARAEEIETGALWPAHRLRTFVVEEQERLTEALDRITDDRWQASVVTAQGRTVPATTIPWLRSREVWIHACDLPSGGDFTAFPDSFTDALITDALDRRRSVQALDIDVRADGRGTDVGDGAGTCVEGPAPDLARWLTRGEASPRLRTETGAPLPQLPPWL
ncbi:maleylpyruvate isomerase family mycothiol-dependent enzyme [Streptomyces sp. NPDC058256]|uniref:maleylpyruvate isomerase family mycothiol-dependent enzyme n=1 Tax=Streptomyces sp. NPDC058256 TaxID=3346408 RepID=UPI0036E4B001